jgi:hypothetical protein
MPAGGRSYDKKLKDFFDMQRGGDRSRFWLMPRVAHRAANASLVAAKEKTGACVDKPSRCDSNERIRRWRRACCAGAGLSLQASVGLVYLMQRTETTRVMVWRALLDGDCKQIHKSKEKLREELLSRNFWYRPNESHRWTFESEELEVPLITGEAHDWDAEGGSGGVHIHWLCPLCGTMHYTDEDTHDHSPFLWLCERGKGIVLVSLTSI